MELSPRRFFFIVSGCFGLLYVFLIPPFQSPDETAHFYRAAHLATGHLMGTKTTNMRLGGELPLSLKEVYRPFAHLRYNYEGKTGPNDFRSAWQVPLNPEKAGFIDFPNVGYYAPFPYLAQAAVLRFLWLFESRPLLLLYAGRLATLAVWITLTLAALQLMPFQKWTLALLALLPSSLFLHASLSGDALTNGLSFWLLAALLSLVFGSKQFNEVSKWLKIALFVASAMVSLSKPVYFPLVLLAWFIPKSKFRHTWHFYGFATLFCSLNLVLIAWWYHYAGGLFIPFDDYHPLFREGVQLNEGVQPRHQAEFVLGHPLSFLKMALASYLESAPATLAHYFGKFGWEKNYLSAWLIGLLFLATAAVALTGQPTNQVLKNRHRLVFFLLGLAMMGALALALYLQWMPVGSERILALNGRYFIPVFPLFFLGLGGILAKLKTQHVLNFGKIAILVSLVFGAWEVVQRYYW